MPKRTTEEQKRLISTDKPKPQITAALISPEPAAGLDAIAQAEWQRIVDAYGDRLTELDQTLLAMYCSAFSRWKKAEAQLAEEGEVLWLDVRDTHGHTTHKKPVVNPMAKIAEAAARAAHKFGEALGFSPASRVKQGYLHKPKAQQHMGAWELMQRAKKS